MEVDVQHGEGSNSIQTLLEITTKIPSLIIALFCGYAKSPVCTRKHDRVGSVALVHSHSNPLL